MTGIDDLFTPQAGKSLTKDQQVGQSRTAMITETPYAQQMRDYQSGEAKTWADGNPQMQLVIPCVTDDNLDGADDDGRRSVFVKAWGKQQRALLDAVRESGAASPSEALTVGAQITVTLDRLEKTKTGFDEKIWVYRISGDTAAAPTQSSPAPAAQPSGKQPTTLDAQIAAGWTDQQILAANPAIGPDVLAYLRAQAK